MMNCCKRVVTHGDRILYSVKLQKNDCNPKFLRRSLSDAVKHDPTTDTGEKPRLRAIDLARRIQQEAARNTEKPESPMSGLQQRVAELKRFTLQLQHVHPNVLAKHLHRSVLYQDKDLIVINKPYGVPVRGDSGVTSISSVLPAFCKMIDGLKVKSETRLLPCLGLEKDATGTLLLARSEQVLEHILALDRNNQVQRKYWVITVGVPVPSEGLIDIPVIEKQVTGPQPHFKMALSPMFRMNESGDDVTKARGHRQAHAAVTKYKVLDSSRGCSLIELQPLTAVKHQMRVHMAFALASPILGDHKYSHWRKLAPQKLPEHVVKKLGLEQSKIRHLPLHLHARQLILPGRNQTDISVSSPLPKYFVKTMNRLQLTFPENKEQ